MINFQFIRFVLSMIGMLVLSPLWQTTLAQSSFEKQSLNKNWMFHLGDDSIYSKKNFDDSSWRKLSVPHDWAIESDFLEDAPAGPNGGALPGGIGWYRKDIFLDKSDLSKCVYVLFDGVYMNAQVYLNGTYVGERPNGYLPILVDISSKAKLGQNILAVRVDNQLQPNSRWYSGCGIYRNVWLVRKPNVHIADNGVYVRALPKEKSSIITVQTTLQHHQNDTCIVNLVHQIFSPTGVKVAEEKTNVRLGRYLPKTIKQSIELDAVPMRWDINCPQQYTLRTILSSEDTISTRFGIRSYKFDAQNGFFLNGRKVVLKGVCMHHDLGCLGSAIHRQAMERQLKILKKMGCNAIRCSHNPPAPEWLSLCDSMGFVVMDESFDMWRRRKTTYDYSTYFEDWYEQDIHDMMLRDRNHPSIMMWSIGNEVLEQWNDISTDTISLKAANLILNASKDASNLGKQSDTLSFNARLTQKLVKLVKKYVPESYVTAGCNEPRPGNHLFRSHALDIIGYNYHEQYLDSISSFFPNKPFVFTESTSALMTRGYYEMPSDSIRIWPKRWDIPFSTEDSKCSAYDNCRTPWGASHEKAWLAVKNNPFVSGLFVWTGFDYLGEPTPFSWPARSSYFGIVDLAGFPKDVYYMYQSEWTNDTVLHLFPHWNWKEGQLIDMWAYYNNADEVELYINGKSQGIRKKNRDCLHASWRVKFEPGTITCISRLRGKEVKRVSRYTAGRGISLHAQVDRTEIHSGGDLVFITIEVLDKEGRIVPTACNTISCKVSGAVTFAGMDNGCQTGHTSLKSPNGQLFNGKCLVVVRSKDRKGKAAVHIESDHLKSVDIPITVN